MIIGEGTTTVRATPAEVFDFVLDLERYRLADHKIGKVGPTTVTDGGARGTARFAGRLRGLPGPPGTYPFTRTDTSLVFGSPIAGPAKLFLGFEGRFDCEVTDAGTVVTHRETFAFKAPWKWAFEPALRRWLAADTQEEMARFGPLVDGADAPDRSDQVTDG